VDCFFRGLRMSWLIVGIFDAAIRWLKTKWERSKVTAMPRTVKQGEIDSEGPRQNLPVAALAPGSTPGGKDTVRLT